MKREYTDQEMISRPPSVSSIRSFINADIEITIAKQAIVKTNKPIKLISKVALLKPPVGVKPKQALIGPVKDTIAKATDKPLTAAAKAVLRNKQPITPAAKVVLGTKSQRIIKPKLPPKPKITNPPTISLNKPINNSKNKTKTLRKYDKPITKKQATATKADKKKKKQEEEVIRWRNENRDVEMTIPVVIGKRKKESQFKSEAKTKKEN